MSYQNPYLVLGLQVSQWSGAEGEDIRRKRKEMLAELGAEGSGFLHLGNHVLGKQDLIRLFDELEDAGTRSFHAFVADNPTLHNFLAESRLDYFYEGDISLLASADPAFLQWVAPAFTKAYNARLAHAFRQRDSQELKVLCAHSIPLPESWLGEAYKDTYQLVHNWRELIQKKIEDLDRGQQPDGSLQELMGDFQISAFNLLPDWFQGIRDGVGESLEQLALTLTRRHQRTRLALLVLRQALKIDLSPSIRGSLEDFQRQLFNIHPEEEWKSWLSDQEGKGVNPWVVAIGVGAIGFALWLFSKWRG